MSAIPKDIQINNTVKYWKKISIDIHEPQTDAEYNKLSRILDNLLDIVGENEAHELMGLIDVISHMIEMYDERKKYHLKNISGVAALKFLMNEYQLKQSDLPEIGSQGIVSEILQGKRKLNLNHVKKLAKRFHVSPDTFID